MDKIPVAIEGKVYYWSPPRRRPRWLAPLVAVVIALLTAGAVCVAWGMFGR